MARTKMTVRPQAREAPVVQVTRRGKAEEGSSVAEKAQHDWTAGVFAALCILDGIGAEASAEQVELRFPRFDEELECLVFVEATTELTKEADGTWSAVITGDTEPLFDAEDITTRFAFAGGHMSDIFAIDTQDAYEEPFGKAHVEFIEVLTTIVCAVASHGYSPEAAFSLRRKVAAWAMPAAVAAVVVKGVCAKKGRAILLHAFSPYTVALAAANILGGDAYAAEVASFTSLKRSSPEPSRAAKRPHLRGE